MMLILYYTKYRDQNILFSYKNDSSVVIRV